MSRRPSVFWQLNGAFAAMFGVAIGTGRWLSSVLALGLAIAFMKFAISAEKEERKP